MAFGLFKKKDKKKDPDKTETAPESIKQKDSPEETTKKTGETRKMPEEAPPPETGQNPEPSSGSFYQRLRSGLKKTRKILTTDIDDIFASGKKLDEDTLEDIEELLITSDIGIQPATELIESLSKAKISDSSQFREELKKRILPYLKNSENTAPVFDEKPRIIMVVGVNGVGKTTTIGKLASRYTQAGKKVMLVAADTFRAAAIEQLTIWAERTGTDIVKHKNNSDPAAVVFDGIEAAQARGVDIVLVDTAGRLHTKVNLMEELKKVKRTINKKIPGAPHEVLLVLDATTGQNALSQTENFFNATGVTGLVLTKLDGTAKGGIVVNLCHTFKIPLLYIGVGEQVDDLQVFEPEEFVEALF